MKIIISFSRFGKTLILMLLLLLAATSATAQQAKLLRQQRLSNWNIPAANYSGITPLGKGRYAVVSDKEASDGFYVFKIEQDRQTGKVVRVESEGFYANPVPQLDKWGNTVRDCEGIAFFPADSTIFISGEGDQRIKEYSLDGRLTRRELSVPPCFGVDSIVPNAGFEALCYDAARHLFWTTTESSLLRDGKAPNITDRTAVNLLRLQSFDDAFRPRFQYAYRMDEPQLKKRARWYAMGISGMCALNDGRLILIERELQVPKAFLGAKAVAKLYIINPANESPLTSPLPLSEASPEIFVKKTKLCEFTTHLRIFQMNFANYEAVCMGDTLNDGRQTLLLLNDSQAGAGKGRFHLKDYIKVVVLP